VKTKWNVDPEDPTTVLRLISELEGISYLLVCLDHTEEELAFINTMKAKYYKTYFRMMREEKSAKHTCKLELNSLRKAV